MIGTYMLSECTWTRLILRADAPGLFGIHLGHSAHPAERVLAAVGETVLDRECLPHQPLILCQRILRILAITRSSVCFRFIMVLTFFISCSITGIAMSMPHFDRSLSMISFRKLLFIDARHRISFPGSARDHRNVALRAALNDLPVLILEVRGLAILPMERPPSFHHEPANTDCIDSLVQHDRVDVLIHLTRLHVDPLIRRDSPVGSSQTKWSVSLVEPGIVRMNVAPRYQMVLSPGVYDPLWGIKIIADHGMTFLMLLESVPVVEALHAHELVLVQVAHGSLLRDVLVDASMIFNTRSCRRSRTLVMHVLAVLPVLALPSREESAWHLGPLLRKLTLLLVRHRRHASLCTSVREPARTSPGAFSPEPCNAVTGSLLLDLRGRCRGCRCFWFFLLGWCRDSGLRLEVLVERGDCGVSILLLPHGVHMQGQRSVQELVRSLRSARVSQLVELKGRLHRGRLLHQREEDFPENVISRMSAETGHYLVPDVEERFHLVIPWIHEHVEIPQVVELTLRLVQLILLIDEAKQSAACDEVPLDGGLLHDVRDTLLHSALLDHVDRLGQFDIQRVETCSVREVVGVNVHILHFQDPLEHCPTSS